MLLVLFFKRIEKGAYEHSIIAIHFHSITYLLWISYLKIQSNLKYSVLYPSFWLYILYKLIYKNILKNIKFIFADTFSLRSLKENLISWVCEYINLMKSSFKMKHHGVWLHTTKFKAKIILLHHIKMFCTKQSYKK